MSSPRAEREASSPPVCVVWHAAGSPPSATLANALAKRGIRTTLCESASMAVAQILSAARTVDPDTVLIFLLVDPKTLEGAAEAVDVVRGYAPACRCWMYDEAEATPLREVTDPDLVLWRGAAPASAAPQLKLVPGDDLDGDAGEDDVELPPQIADGTDDLLTDEELDLLLDEGDEDADGIGERR